MRIPRNWAVWGAMAVGVATAAPSAMAVDLVVNGGFETGSFFPWIAPGPIANEQLFFVSGGGGHTGQRYGHLSSTQLRFVSQFLPTTAGQDYELRFWIRTNGPLLGSIFRVQWEGGEVFSHAHGLQPMPWTEFSVPLHADFSGSLLEFGQAVFPFEYHIDDISVVPVPAPSAAAVLVMGGAAMALRRRRRHA